VALAAALWAAGCGVVYLPGPAFTVRSLFLYLRLGARESAWQELAPDLQRPGRPHPAPAPDGGAALALRWRGEGAFARQAPRQLRPFLHGARVSEMAGGSLGPAEVEARARGGERLWATLVRVDNEWLVERIVVEPPPA
jgi:hypothetical protein